MIAVAACYPIETRWVVPPDGVRLVRTPIGERAADALETFEGREPVSLLVSTGFCGALKPELRAGDLVLADVVRHRGEEILISTDLLRRVRDALGDGARVGACESVPAVVDVERKRALAPKGGVSVDMESGPLARWAADRGVPFLSVRVVLDRLDSDLPFSPDRSATATFVRHPIRGIQVAWAAAGAARRLGDALNGLWPALKEER